MALLFGALVKYLDGEMKKLDFGQSLTVTNWTVSEDIFLRGNASFDLKITRLHQEGKPTFRAEWFMEKGKPASQTRIWEAALLRPDVEFSVYGWAPAKIGNRPFQVRRATSSVVSPSHAWVGGQASRRSTQFPGHRSTGVVRRACAQHLLLHVRVRPCDQLHLPVDLVARCAKSTLHAHPLRSARRFANWRAWALSQLKHCKRIMSFSQAT